MKMNLSKGLGEGGGGQGGAWDVGMLSFIKGLKRNMGVADLN